MKYTPRTAEGTVKRLLKAFPVIGITGPRQSGKSTLLQHLLKDYRYVTFDDVTQIKLYEDDPIGFMNHYSEKVIFDEVQLVPEIFSSIKLMVDRNRGNYGNFVLTGSSQFAFLKSASESLAGRIGLLSLLPFQASEIPKDLLKNSIFSGSYPELVLRSYEESSLWYSSYVDTYLNKDLRTLAEIGDIRDFRRLIQLLAANIAQTVDYSYYAKQIGVSAPTIKRWISILEASYIIFLVPPYYKNYGKRITKSPKLYFFDTGLVSFLTGIRTFEQYNQGPLGGPLFENYVISELYKKELHTLGDGELFFLRTQDKAEIDLIIDRKTKKELYEIKKTSSFKPNMIRHLKSFREENDQTYLIYQGNDDSYQGITLCNYLKILS
ncbi:MAG: ATP-binding protein [Chlamydiales bacterium]|nr:ATP-binding protein [Chlamydiales bacterium]